MKRKGNWLITENDSDEILLIKNITGIENYSGTSSRTKIYTTGDFYAAVKEKPKEILKILQKRD